MDDIRTQQALDELADLFLSGQSPSTSSTKPNDAVEGLTGPAPIRLGPKLRSQGQSPASSGESSSLRLHDEPDMEDEDGPLASIGLEDVDTSEVESTRSDIRQPTEADHESAYESSGHAVAVEAVILGNLPGLSGPWLTQYAQLLAQEHGPVVILHVDDDLIDLELVEPMDRNGPGSAGRGGVSLRMPPGGGRLDPVSVLEALLESPENAPGTVLVHLDPVHDEQGLARALMIDDWTLLCGADDLSIVGGYRLLKTLVDQDPRVAQRRVGLMIMGSDPDVSQQAARKFQSAAKDFLNAPVQLLGWQKQMVPVNLRHLGRFEDVVHAWPRLAEWFDRYAATDPLPEPQDDPSEAPVSGLKEREQAKGLEQRRLEPRPQEAMSVEPDVAGIHRDEAVKQAPKTTVVEPPPFIPKHEPKPKPVIEPEPVSAVHASSREQAAASPTIASPTGDADRGGMPDTESSSQPDALDLSAFLMAGPGAIPGGVVMEARCPQQPGTQLLLDQAGRLHLLHRHDSQATGFEGLQSALVDLLQARRWVREHLQLLQLTQRQLRLDAEAEPVLHLFTDRADWATALIARLGDALKLHLLQEVRVGDQRTWFSTPLN